MILKFDKFVNFCLKCGLTIDLVGF